VPSTSCPRYHVVVVGAGLVGASFALALRGLRVAVIEPSPPSAPADAWDARIYALNPASVAFLDRLGAWSALDRGRVQAVERMQIHGDAANAQLEFSAYESGVAALAYIVESGRLQHALWELLQRAPDITLHTGTRCADVRFDADEVVLTLDDGTNLHAELLVGADGANSWVRRAAQLRADAESYDAMGVVANFVCERAHGGTAFQWFRDDGVLAYLPLPGNHMSVVWSTNRGSALLQLSHEELAMEVAEAGHRPLGALQLVTPAQAFPLQKMRVPNVVATRVALIGDAAHVVHPLAGQGVNLGFGDAEVLARTIAAREPHRSCADVKLLRAYQRERAEPVTAMRTVTHGLQRLFAARDPVLATLRNRGLRYTDRSAMLKNMLVRHALG